MVRLLWLMLVNLRRALGNLLRRLLVRQVPYLVINVDGALPEFAPRLTLWQRRLQGKTAPLSLQALRQLFRRLEKDPKVPGVILRIQGFHGGWATLTAFHTEVARLTASGKRVLSYLLAGDQAAFLLACAAPTIITPPSNTLLLPGLRRESLFFKDALARVGVEAQVFAVSPFKAAYEPFTRTDFSDENRAQVTRLMDARFEAMIQLVAQARRQDAAKIRAAVDRAILEGPAQKDAGLVDALLYEDQLAAFLGTAEKPATLAMLSHGLSRVAMPYARRVKRTVGVVTVHGAILRGKSRELPVPVPMLGQQQAGADSVVEALRLAQQMRQCAAVVLHVDSPGGDAFASDLIWREVARVNVEKPVVVCMHNVAASGGYYVAAPARHIIASPGTVTGSIGVIAMRLQFQGLLRLLSIHSSGMQQGHNAGLLSATQPLTTDEVQAFTQSIGAAYSTFKTRVQDGRKLPEETLEPLCGGRVWNGAEALQHKLVDALGGFPDALAKAQQLAGLPVDRDAPYLLLRAQGTGELLPQPWKDAPATAAAALDSRLWTVLPWETDAP